MENQTAFFLRYLPIKACVDVFFNNIGVEMIRDGIELQGEFYIQEREAAIALLQATNA